MTTATCAACGEPIEPGDSCRPYEEGFAHVDCAEVRVFVYGTLRTGGPLANLLPAHLDREPATVENFALHYGTGHRSYPYLVREVGAVTHGEVITVPLDDAEATAAYLETAAMERNAGYSVDPVIATLKSGGRRLCDAFVYPGTVGPPVPDGDWTRAPEWVEVDPAGFVPRRPAPASDDGEPEALLASGAIDGTFAIVLATLDGATALWRGHSFTACGKAAKALGLGPLARVGDDDPRHDALLRLTPVQESV